MHMELLRKPCILYETVELLFAYVNTIPPEQLTMEGDYCIPEAEIGQIMADACRDLDPSEPILQHFFGRHPIADEPDQFTCLAFCMVYTFIEPGGQDIAAQMEKMCATWESLRRKSYRISAINRFALDIAESQEAPILSLSSELRKLPVSDGYFALLLETFSDFDYQMQQLRICIEPVAQRLWALLEPYVERAAPLEQAWLEFWQTNRLDEFVRQRMGTTIHDDIRSAGMTFRYLNARYALGRYIPGDDTFWMHLGVGLHLTLQPAYQKRKLNDREFAAFRLLGDRGRSEIVRVLSDKYLSMQELTAQLGQNSGTVFRNLNNLLNAELLIRELRGDRFLYHTNMAYIRKIFAHVLEAYEDEYTLLRET